MYGQLINRIKQYIQISYQDITMIESLFDKQSPVKGGLFLQEGIICGHPGVINMGLVCYYITIVGNDVVHNCAMENEFISNYDSPVNNPLSCKNPAPEPDYFTYSTINFNIYIKPSHVAKDPVNYEGSVYGYNKTYQSSCTHCL